MLAELWACGYAWLEANPSSTSGIGVAIGLFIAVLVTPIWYGQLSGLGAGAGRLGARSMHLMMAAASVAGAASAVATPIVCRLLLKAGLMSDDGAAIPMILGAMPLGSAIAALALAPFLPVGRFGKGQCMNCGYDLAGLPATAKTDGAIRCPECGYHPSVLAATEG